MPTSTASVSQAGVGSSSVILSESMSRSLRLLMCTTNSIGGEGFSETRRNLKRSQAIEAHHASFSQSKVKYVVPL
ncbi:hypothetical protein YC2023_052542 [Brassica napus]